MTFNPLIDSPPDSVDLPAAPLYKVIIQLRFSEILQIENKDQVSAFQEKIRSEYPLLQKINGLEFSFGAEGAIPPSPHGSAKVTTMWQFYDLTKNWTVVLSPTFLTLETKSYDCRSDFESRFQRILAALIEVYSPIIGTRLGVRYIDRVDGPLLDSLHKLVRPEALGLLTASFQDNVALTVSESLLTAPRENAMLRLRWGVLPPNTTIDPSAIEGTEKKSWILDQDMFRDGEFRVESPAVVSSDIHEFSARMYGMFRWVVTNDFLRAFGGEV